MILNPFFLYRLNPGKPQISGVFYCLKYGNQYVIFTNMTKYAIIYTFNGQAKWDLVKAGSVTEARRKLLDKYPSYNIRILDISTL